MYLLSSCSGLLMTHGVFALDMQGIAQDTQCVCSSFEVNLLGHTVCLLWSCDELLRTHGVLVEPCSESLNTHGVLGFVMQ